MNTPLPVPALDPSATDLDVPAQERLAAIAAEANAEHRACEGVLQRSLAHAIRAGELLTEAKALCAHGRWLPWLAAHFEGSERTAQLYMRVATGRAALESKSATVADLTLQDAAHLLAEPRAVPDPLPLPLDGAQPPALAQRPTRELQQEVRERKAIIEERRAERRAAAALPTPPEPPPAHVQHGRGQLWTGDCLEVLPTLPADSVQLVLTSPPYNCRWNYGDEDLTGDNLPTDEYLALLHVALAGIARVLRPGGILAMDLPASVKQDGIREWPIVALMAVHLASTPPWVYRGQKIWVKSKPSDDPSKPPIIIPDDDGADLTIPSGTVYSTRTTLGGPTDWYLRHCHHVLLFASKATTRIPDAPTRWPGAASLDGLTPYLELVKDVALWPPGRAGRKADAEPPEFPSVLVEDVLRLCAPGGGIVLDPFAGSGSVARVGMRLGYEVWLIEKNERYAARLARMLQEEEA